MPILRPGSERKSLPSGYNPTAEPTPTPILAKRIQPKVDTHAEIECSERSNPAKHDANDTTSELQIAAGKGPNKITNLKT